MTTEKLDLLTLIAHPFADVFPLMGEADRAELRASIEIGWDPTQPIVLYEGKILDGRNRLDVVREINARPRWSVMAQPGDRVRSLGMTGTVLEVKGDSLLVNWDGAPGNDGAWISTSATSPVCDPIVPTFETFEGSADDALNFVLRRNLARRHLSTSQRAMVAATLVTSRKGGQTKAELSGAVLSQYQAASRLGVSERSVRNAIKLLAREPEAAASIASGERKVNAEKQGNEWYTPDEYLEAARTALGAIDLDPASCAIAQRRVRARVWHNEKANGLKKPWSGRVFLNPPFDDPGPWVARLLEAHKRGKVSAAVVITNNCTETAWGQALLTTPGVALCFPSSRISFHKPDGSRGTGNRYAQIVWYLGPNPRAFLDAFGRFGAHGVCRGKAVL
jgi:hypothetical protein